jgi:hypothetical protein
MVKAAVKNIRNGILAFRHLPYLVCHRLIADVGLNIFLNCPLIRTPCNGLYLISRKQKGRKSWN